MTQNKTHSTRRLPQQHPLRSFTQHALFGLAFAVGGAGTALAAPTQETTATPPAVTAPGSVPPTTVIAPESGTPGSRSPVDRTGRDPRGMTTPAAPTGRAVPPSPSEVIAERDVPGGKVALSEREARQAEKVVRELHKANALEITLASLAVQRASVQSVKDYGRDLIEMHQAADAKVAAYANSKGIAADVTPVSSLSRADAQNTAAAVNATAPSPAGAATGMVNDRVASAGNSAVNANAPTATPSPTVSSSATGHGTGVPAGSGTATIAGNTPRAPSPAAERVEGGAAVPAAADAVAVPAPKLDAEGRRHLAKLEKLEGPAFDKQFLTTMVQGHSKVLAKVKAFEKGKTIDADLSALLSDTRTMVEEHLSRAKDLQRETSARTLGAL